VESLTDQFITKFIQNCLVYIQCKGDIVVVDIKQHKSQSNNSNFIITQSAKFFQHCVSRWKNICSKT